MRVDSKSPPGGRPDGNMIEATLITAIQSRTARVGVIGQGYVGLPLAAEFVRAGFSVTGLDTDLEAADGVLILTDHPVVDYRHVVEGARLVVDTGNVTWGMRVGGPGRPAVDRITVELRRRAAH